MIPTRSSRAAVRLVLLASILCGIPAVGTALPVQARPTPPATESTAVAYQLDAQHDGYTPINGPAPPLRLLWSLPLPGKISYPLIVGNTVFVALSTAEPDTGQVRAVDLRTGRTRWGPVMFRSTYGSITFAYDRSTIFADTRDGQLTALRASDGNRLWTTRIPDQSQFTGTPTALGGIVYLGGAGQDGTVYAISEQTGAVLWSQAVHGGENALAVGNGVVYGGFPCGQVYAFDGHTGAVLWHQNPPCSGGGGLTPILASGRLYTRDLPGAPLITRDAATGNPVVDHSRVFGAAVDPRRLYLSVLLKTTGAGVTFRAQFTLRAEDRFSGHLLWSFAGDGSLKTPPIIAGRYLFAASEQGQLYTLDASTGRLLGTVNLPEHYPYPDEHNGGMASSVGVLVVSTGQHLSAYVPGPASMPSATRTAAPATTPVAGGTPAAGGPCLDPNPGHLCITAVSPKSGDTAKSVLAVTVTFSSAVQHGTISVSLSPGFATGHAITVSDQSFSGNRAVVPLPSVPDRGSYVFAVTARDASGRTAFIRMPITLD